MTELVNRHDEFTLVKLDSSEPLRTILTNVVKVEVPITRHVLNLGTFILFWSLSTSI